MLKKNNEHLHIIRSDTSRRSCNSIKCSVIIIVKTLCICGLTVTMSGSFGTDENVTVHFVIPDKKISADECSDDMKRAYQVCEEHSLSPSWILGKDCLTLEPTKADVFVCEEFTGSPFEYLKTYNCIIIGPRCVLDCLAADILIPKSKFPLFTLAMRDMVVTTTGFTDPEKTLLGEKIQYMAGTYSQEYRKSVTHLVANHLRNVKYEKAVENLIPVMTEKWVETVWEESKKRNVHANDEEFQQYKCPVFHKLVITCSQISRKHKETLKSNVNNNGGEFCGDLRVGRTNVLIIPKPCGDKFTHANIWKIPCVIPEWITDSIAKGHALPVGKYALGAFEQKCSTPEHGTDIHLPDISASIIHHPASSVNETVSLDSTCAPKTPIHKSTVISLKQLESPKKDKHLQLINRISVSDVKKAGVFLDGCNIYLSGFSPEYTEKLRRIINSGGATRFNEISDSVTHVIVGDFVQSDIRILKSKGSRLHVVTVEWLVESVRLRSTAPEDQFSCLGDLPSPIEFQSPLSKKGLLALHSQNRKHVRSIDMDSPKSKPSPKESLIPKVLFDQYAKTNEDTMLSNEAPVEIPTNDQTMTQNDDSHYSQPKENTEYEGRPSDLTQMSSTDGSQAEFFADIAFSIAGYAAIDTKEIERLIKTAGGKVVTKKFKGIPDYGVVPLHGASLFHTTTEIVTHLWLDDCADEGKIMPVKYYHQPVNFDVNTKPLSECVVTTTSYNGPELRFVTELLEGLGAVHQSMMARINRPADNLLATTHLICPTDIDLTTSRKYKAACKWAIPSLSHHWLLSCAKERKRVDEEPFLVSPESHDASVVIARTPLPQGTKRKFTDDHMTSHLETRVITTCAPSSVLHSTSTPQPPSTPDYNCPRRISLPMQQTPKESVSATKTPDDAAYATPRSPGNIPTPDTPYGRVFKENPSPKTRKMWKKWIDQWPEEPQFKAPPPKQRRNSTPMTEIFHKCWQKFAHEPYMKNFRGSQNGSQIEDAEEDVGPSQFNSKLEDNLNVEINQEANARAATPSPGAGINTQLQELNQILDSASKASGERKKDSDSDGHSTPHAHSARNVARAPESLDLCMDLVEWVDPVISNQQKPPPVFMLTSIDNREHYEEMIRSLGGIVSSQTISTSLSEGGTHLVCQLPSRNEKILASIASGRWILEKRYLDDSKKEGHFLDEEDYEWGNPKASYLQKLLKPGSLNEQLSKAIYRWRCKVQSTGKKAFVGLKAIVCSSPEKAELYKRIIIAGGGEILNISPPFSEPGNATVCILELAKVQHRVDLQALVDKKVPCVHPLYLNDFLINDPIPDVMDCLITEYKALQ